MSTLFGKSVASTYKDLLQVSNNNIGVDDVVRYIEDGEGTKSALALSTDMVVLSGHLLPQVNSQVDLGSAEYKFRHLFLSDNTIYIGDQTFNTSDIKVVKDIQTTATVPISSVIELAQGAAQAGDIDASFFTDDFTNEYTQIKTLASNSTQTGANASFESVNVTGAITGPEVMVLDPAAVGDNTGRVVIAGDLQVDGTTTTVNSTTISTSGKTIELANGATDAGASDGAGVYVSGSQATLKYSAGTDAWTSNKNLVVQGATNLNGDTTVNGGLNATGNTQLTQLDVAGNTTLNNQLLVGSVFRVNTSGAIGGVAPNTIGQTIVWNGSEWVTGVSSGGDETREVPEGFVYSLQAGMSDFTINFQQEYTVPPAISTDLQITGGGEIIPYVITSVTNTSFSVQFAEVIPDNNYELHITFGGRDVYWTQGALNELNYADGDVNITNGLHVGGNLTVQGETTTINATELSIEDRNIMLANNTNSQHLSGLNGQGGITWGADELVNFKYDSTKGFTFTADGDLNGNVGVGTTSPDVDLHIGTNTGDAKSIRLEATGTKEHKLQFASDGNVYGQVGGGKSDSGEGDLRFYSYSGGLNEAMRIDSSGNVGIGTTSPGAKLEVLDSYQGYDSSTTPNRSLDVRTGSPQNSYSSIGLESRSPNNTDAAISTITCVPVGNGSGALAFGTRHQYSFNEKMRINSNGNVGIGTTDPGAKLDLYTSTEWGSITNEALTISNNGYAGSVTSPHSLGRIKWNTNAFIAASIDAVRTRPDSGNETHLIFSTNPGGSSAIVQEAMRIGSNGNVGIGTTSPDAKLHIYASASGVNPSTLLTLENYSSDLEANSTFIDFKFTDTNDNEDPQVQIGAEVGQNSDANSAIAEGAGAFVVKTNYPITEGDPTAGIQYNDATNLAERLRVDYRGMTSIKRYDVINTNDAAQRTQLRPVLQLMTSNNNTTGGSSVVYRGHGGSIDFYTPTYQNNIPTPTARIAAQIDSDAASTWGGRLSFWCTMNQDSDYEERARLDHAGRWNIYANSSVAQIIHTEKPAGDASGGNYFLRGYANAALHDSSNAVTGFEIFSNGDMRNANGVYGTGVSDARLKENVVDASGKLQDLLSLKVKNFNLIGHDKKQIGFIAQEFEQVFPSLVSSEDTREYDDDGNVISGIEDSKSIKVGMEFAILTKAIQEQQAMIQELKTQNEQLINRIENLENK